MAKAEATVRPQQAINLVLLNVCLAQFLSALNQRSVLVALPTLTRHFHTSLTTIQWVILAYELTSIGLVLTLGRLGDLFGRRRMYQSGFVLFICGSILCSLSQSVAQMIAFRILQAVGGSLLLANGRAIVASAFPPEQRGRALGLTSMAFHVGFLTGPTLGGFLIDTAGWRSIFYLNVPVGLAGAFFAWAHLKESRVQGSREALDVRGAVLLLLANTSFLYALNQLPHWGWRDPAVLAFFIVSAVGLLLFIQNEIRAEAPILSFSLFRNRIFSSGILSLFFISSTQASIQFLMPFYLQEIRGFSATKMGWMIIANSAVIVLVAPVAGWLSDRLGSRLLCTTGAALIVIAQYIIASLTIESPVAHIVIPLAVSGLGWGLFNSPNQSAVLGSVRKDQAGVASGMTITTARIGIAIGFALASAIFAYGLASSGLSQNEIESPAAWASSPQTFMQAFNRTIHIVNGFTLLAVLFSALRGRKHQN
jgi:EmrB/QacA subfamily drug resistance transporter